LHRSPADLSRFELIGWRRPARFDGTAEVIAKELSVWSSPHASSRGRIAALRRRLNEGRRSPPVAISAFLNSDDYYAPDRLAALVDGIARAGYRLGFVSLVAQVTLCKGEATDGTVPRGSYWSSSEACSDRNSNSFALLQHNVAVSTGNLFVERSELFASLGGFRDLPSQSRLEFCLRAAALAEPMVVRRPLYFYRRTTQYESANRRTRPRRKRTGAGEVHRRRARGNHGLRESARPAMAGQSSAHADAHAERGPGGLWCRLKRCASSPRSSRTRAAARRRRALRPSPRRAPPCRARHAS
jgi:hypothetical protein